MSAKAVQRVHEAKAGPQHRKVGRPPQYGELLSGIARQFGAGVWVRAVSFTDAGSARVALKKIRSGQRPVPGGAEAWVLESCIEDVEVEGGGTVKGSALYVKWVGPLGRGGWEWEE
jgi:hypothetical protein